MALGSTETKHKSSPKKGSEKRLSNGSVQAIEAAEVVESKNEKKNSNEEKAVKDKCIICKKNFSNTLEFQIHLRTHLKKCKVTLKRLETTTLAKPKKAISKVVTKSKRRLTHSGSTRSDFDEKAICID